MEDCKLTIVITTADEPLVVNGFIREIIKAKRPQIVGIALIRGRGAIPRISKGGKASMKKRSAVLSKTRNLLSLFLIFGIVDTLWNAFRILYFYLSKAINRVLPFFPTNSVKYIAKSHGIPLEEFPTVNNQALLEFLCTLTPDLIINQAPGILRKHFLNAASVGVLNRHNALLPKNRGRFSPFWALYKQEKYAGVSVHFVTEDLDAGEIIVQEKIRICETETVSSLVKKCYAIAPLVMIKAIEKLESDEYKLLPNRDDEASYNTNPTLNEVIQLWKRRFKMTKWLTRMRACGSQRE